MTITFKPASQDFGNVEINTSDSIVVTIENDGPSAVPFTAPTTPFTTDPAGGMVPGCAADGTPGALDVTVTFTPQGAQFYQSSLLAGGVTCGLGGTGTLPDPEELPNTKKSLLIKVPDYTDGLFEVRKKQTQIEEEMHSFLRLGAFDYTAEPTRAKELLALMHQAGPPGDPARSEKYGAAFDGSGDFLDAPPFQPRASAADAADAGNGDVFFFDDVRIRDVDVAAAAGTAINDDSVHGHGLTMLQRQKESSRLYSRGGWRDHSDGNRISTTYGDKVEVIRGNYKMIVMGRQDDPGEAMGWEVSGSHVTDYAPGTMPGAVYWHQWVPDYKFTDSDGVVRTGVWLLVNTTENVYEYARYGGNFREERWGDLLETYVGSDNPPSGQIATDHSQGSGGHTPPAHLGGIQYDLPSGVASTRTTPDWPLDNKDMVRSNPHIVEKTWARRIDSWTGSDNCPVPEIHEMTIANKIYGQTGSSTNRVHWMEDKTWADHVVELTDVAVNIASNTRAGSITEATTAGAIVSATTAATIVESTTAGLTVGITAGLASVELKGVIGQAEINMGAVLDIFLGAKLELQIGAGIAASTSGFVDYDIPWKKATTLEDVEMALSKKITALQKKVTCLDIKHSVLKFDVVCLKMDLGV